MDLHVQQQDEANILVCDIFLLGQCNLHELYVSTMYVPTTYVTYLVYRTGTYIYHKQYYLSGIYDLYFLKVTLFVVLSHRTVHLKDVNQSQLI